MCFKYITLIKVKNQITLFSNFVCKRVYFKKINQKTKSTPLAGYGKAEVPQGKMRSVTVLKGMRKNYTHGRYRVFIPFRKYAKCDSKHTSLCPFWPDTSIFSCFLTRCDNSLVNVVECIKA